MLLKQTILGCNYSNAIKIFGDKINYVMERMQNTLQTIAKFD